MEKVVKAKSNKIGDIMENALTQIQRALDSMAEDPEPPKGNTLAMLTGLVQGMDKMIRLDAGAPTSITKNSEINKEKLLEMLRASDEYVDYDELAGKKPEVKTDNEPLPN